MQSVHMWNKTINNGIYTHNFTYSDVKMLSLAFRKSLVAKQTRSANTVKLYEVRLSNTREGGAAECTECELGGSEAG